MTDEAEDRLHPIQRIAAKVHGVVQGVGFRPFVFRLATEEHLTGFIGNDTDGVTVELQGSRHNIDTFLSRLRSETPPLARIDSVYVEDRAPQPEDTFRIIASEAHGHVTTGIPADAATCPDCLRELLDPADRRYRYPFINCTNCGPRFTITRKIPYDRPQTSMAAFRMCHACQAEYDDPLNRRFHAQPNACWDCGPSVWLENPNQAQPASNPFRADPAVQATIDLLLSGKIVAVKGIGGFHLSVDATNDAAVQRLRQRKHRYGKPLAVMVRDLDAARALCNLSPDEEALLASPARPIVLATHRYSSTIAPSVAPGIPWLGIFLPYAPLQHLLFADIRIRALVMTSANLSEEPIAIDNDEARLRLASIADAFLLHDREILQRCDDSVQAVIDSAPQIIRRARGFVPLAVELPFEVAPMLAVGGHLKSVFTLAKGRFAYQSQHLGDLENITGLQFFEESLQHLMHTFDIEPECVVHDMHPGYLSTTWAKDWATARRLPLIAVQHHHAHIAACIAEHKLGASEEDARVLGLSLDGTGYGTDGHIWGGEVIIADQAGFQRFAHLDYVPMPGGEAAIREPWRMAIGHLHSAGIDVFDPIILDRLGTTTQEVSVLLRMIERSLNTPMTSSCGRLFDAVAALVLGRRQVDYEAQAAIELEGIAHHALDRPGRQGYLLELWEEDSHPNVALLKMDRLWHAILDDLRSGIPAAQIAAQLHSDLVEGWINAAANARIATGISRVVLSGGCLHNRRLARLLRAGLEEEGFHVYQHRQVSPGDGGLSYGQIAVASATMRRRMQPALPPEQKIQ